MFELKKLFLFLKNNRWRAAASESTAVLRRPPVGLADARQPPEKQPAELQQE